MNDWTTAQPTMMEEGMRFQRRRYQREPSDPDPVQPGSSNSFYQLLPVNQNGILPSYSQSLKWILYQ
jgi:hypothetical protein